MACVACNPATGADPDLWDPVLDPGDAGDVSACERYDETLTPVVLTGGGEEAGVPTLRYRFTTVSYKGKFAPANVGAVWVTDDDDELVGTLDIWATKRIKHLKSWQTATGGEDLDAVSGATRNAHRETEISWEMADRFGDPLPDGAYRVYAEFTEANAAGKCSVIEIVKGPGVIDVGLPDLASFVGRHVEVAP